MKLVFHLHIQSQSDIITNSSSELFCVIQGHLLVMQEIVDYLNSIGCKVSMDKEGYQDGLDTPREDLYSIYFDVDYGDNERLANQVVALLKEVLSTRFEDKPFEILDDVCY